MAANITIQCPNCGKKGEAPAEYAGRVAACNECGTKFSAVAVGKNASSSSETAVARGIGADGVPLEWKVGDTILNLYAVNHVFTSGGMGLVYRVRHQSWNVDLAVKSPRAQFFQTETHKQNFVAEAQTWVNLGMHPHIASCFYVRTLGGIPRVFAEYIEGGSLTDWIKSRKLYEGGQQAALERILDIAIQFAWGLHYAHEQGLVHQDVKPANVLMTNDGTAKVSDFGLAKARASTGETQTMNRGGTTMVTSGGLTPAYASPEQVGRAKLTRRTDMWSWAVSVLEMFTGEITWMSGSAAGEALEAYGEANESSELLPLMPTELAALLRRCFENDPAARPATMQLVADELRGVYQSTVGKEYLRIAPQAAKALADTLNNKAVSLIDLGQRDEAEKVLEEALKLRGGHPQARYNLTLLRWASGEADDVEVLDVADAEHKLAFKKLCDTQLQDLNTSRAITQIPTCLSTRKTPENWTDVEVSGHDLLLITNSGGQIRYYPAFSKLEPSDVVNVAAEALASPSRPRFDISANERTVFSIARCTNASTVDKWVPRYFNGHAQVGMRRGGGNLGAGGDLTDAQFFDLETKENVKITLDFGVFDFVSHIRIGASGKTAVSVHSGILMFLWSIVDEQGTRQREIGHRLIADFGSKSWLTCDYHEGVGVVATAHKGGKVIITATDASTKSLECGFDLPYVRVVRFSHDGNLLAAVSRESILLWNIRDRRVIHELHGQHRVNALFFSQDDRLLISCNREETMVLWDVQTGNCLCQMKGKGVNIWAGFLQNNRRLMSIGTNGALKIWDLHSAEVALPLQVVRPTNVEKALRDEREAEAKRLRDEREAESERLRDEREVDATRGKAIQLAKQLIASSRPVEALQCLRLAMQHEGLERDTVLLNAVAAIGRRGKLIKVRDCWTKTNIVSQDGDIKIIDVAADGQSLLTVGKNQVLRIWDFPNLSIQRVLPQQSVLSLQRIRISHARFSATGSHFVVGGKDGTIKIWDTRSLQCKFSVTNPCPILEVSMNSNYDICAVLECGKIMVWNNGRIKAAFDIQSALIALRNSGEKREANHKQLVRNLQKWDGQPFTSGTFSPDGRWCAVTVREVKRKSKFLYTILIWDLQSGTCSVLPEVQTSPFVKFNPQSTHLVTDTSDIELKSSGDVYSWTFAKFFDNCASTTVEINLEDKQVTSLAFSTDGTILVSGRKSGKVLFWHMNKEQYDPYLLPKGILKSFALTLDSRFLILGKTDSIELLEIEWEYLFPASLYEI